jgi:hypothetical protein
MPWHPFYNENASVGSVLESTLYNSPFSLIKYFEDSIQLESCSPFFDFGLKDAYGAHILSF